MINNLKVKRIAILYVFLLFLYSYWAMNSLMVEGGTGSGNLNLVIIACVIIGITTCMLHSSYLDYSSLSRYWILWLIWTVVHFVMFSMAGVNPGFANFVKVLFCPLTYLFFFCLRLISHKIEKPVIIGFVLLFFFTAIRHIQQTFTLTGMMIEEGGDGFLASNFVFWPMCCIPFIFLVKNKYITFSSLILLAYCVILSQKRSALVAFVIIASTYIIIFFKEKRNKISFKLILFYILSIVVFYILANRMMEYLESIQTRMSLIMEDKGSGRVFLYGDVFNSINNFDFPEWMLGRGLSSIRLTGHSNAHNDALQMLYEYGLFGLFFYLTLCVIVLRRGRYLYRIKHSDAYSYWVSLVVFFVLGTVSNLTVFNNYFSFICAFWGICDAHFICKKT